MVDFGIGKVIVIKVPTIISESVWNLAQAHLMTHRKSGYPVKILGRCRELLLAAYAG